MGLIKMPDGSEDFGYFKSSYPNQDNKIEYKPIGTEHILSSGFIKFVKHTKPIWMAALMFYSSVNCGVYFITRSELVEGQNKTTIEQNLEEIEAANSVEKIAKFLLKDIGKPGRELAYWLHEKK